MQLSVTDVLSKKDVKVFHQIARDLYKDDTHFISHIDQDIDAIFNPKLNKAFEDGGAKRWIVYAGQTAVGKVAAFYRKDAHKVFERKDYFDFKYIGIFENTAYAVYRLKADFFKNGNSMQKNWTESVIFKKIKGKFREEQRSFSKK